MAMDRASSTVRSSAASTVTPRTPTRSAPSSIGTQSRMPPAGAGSITTCLVRKARPGAVASISNRSGWAPSPRSPMRPAGAGAGRSRPGRARRRPCPRPRGGWPPSARRSSGESACARLQKGSEDPFARPTWAPATQTAPPGVGGRARPSSLKDLANRCVQSTGRPPAWHTGPHVDHSARCPGTGSSCPPPPPRPPVNESSGSSPFAASWSNRSSAGRASPGRTTSRTPTSGSWCWPERRSWRSTANAWPSPPGDWTFLPAGVPHSVIETEAGTNWLAVHLSAG